jgi:putative oxidoreductase
MNTEALAHTWSPRLLGVLRIVTSFLFLQHGSSKLLHVPYVEWAAHTELMSLGGVAGVLELIGGALLLIGLFSRPVAFILSGEMAVAYFMAHAPTAFLPIINQGELAVVFCFVFLYLWAAGPGAWSVDGLRRKSA